MSNKNLEQRINIKFCVRVGKSASETSALLTVAYGEFAMKKSSGFEWYRQKRKGQMQMWTEYEQTVNQQCCLEVLTRLQESVWRKIPEFWPPP
jgi:hypothetical protein